MENSKKLLEKIQSENVKQKNRLEFKAKNIFFWILFFFSVLIGGLAMSVIIYIFSQAEFDLLEHITHSRLEFFLGMLPILWIVFSILFLGISIWGIRSTKKGYKYSPLVIVASSLLFSAILGVVFYYSGGAKNLDNIFAKNIPGYQSVEEKRLLVWSMPEDGFLSGTIFSIENGILLKDWNGKEWQIDTSNAFIRGRVSIQIGEQVKIIGSIERNNIFRATEVRPWNGQGGNGTMHNF
ncbi:hypothetical protein KKG46_03515 [Patescibacteria group bacterium]|nr:hypothetical protein [Patescibacteria group bacterium]